MVIHLIVDFAKRILRGIRRQRPRPPRPGLSGRFRTVERRADGETVSLTGHVRAKESSRQAASGGRWDRPELHRMLDQLREGDVVVVWKLDRLSRSLKDVLHIMEQIGAVGAGFRSITEAIDTTTVSGSHDDADGR